MGNLKDSESLLMRRFLIISACMISLGLLYPAVVRAETYPAPTSPMNPPRQLQDLPAENPPAPAPVQCTADAIKAKQNCLNDCTTLYETESRKLEDRGAALELLLAEFNKECVINGPRRAVQRNTPECNTLRIEYDKALAEYWADKTALETKKKACDTACNKIFIENCKNLSSRR